MISDGHTLDSSFYRFDTTGLLISDTEAGSVPTRTGAMQVQLAAWAEQAVDACQHGRTGQFADIEEKVLGAEAAG